MHSVAHANGRSVLVNSKLMKRRNSYGCNLFVPKQEYVDRDLFDLWSYADHVSIYYFSS